MHFRYARHTTNINRLGEFYTTILGLEELGNFENHEGYNGIFLGLKEKDWHLEFTENGEIVNHLPDEDDLLVYYPTDEKIYQQIIFNLEKYKIEISLPKNPYWKENGIHIKDPDGFGVIISNLKIKKQLQ